MTNGEEIRVLIADDEEGMRMILRKMIAKAEGFTLCAEATSGQQMLELVEEYTPPTGVLSFLGREPLSQAVMSPPLRAGPHPLGSMSMHPSDGRGSAQQQG